MSPAHHPIPQAAASATIVLRVTAGPHQGEEFVLDRHATFLLGRSAEAHCALPEKDPYLSRHQFLIEANPPACRLVDLKSKNGTKVNGVRVEAVDLKNGDTIEVGETHLVATVRSVDEGVATRSKPTTPPDAFDTLAPEKPKPLEVPGYRLQAILGEGGMGAVYQAIHEGSGETVALKTLRPALNSSDDALRRFEREARVLRSLLHRHIVGFREFGRTEQFLYLTMELIDGGDARRLKGGDGSVAIGRAVRLACQVLDALAYAHARDIVHRDLKPANVLVAVENGEEVAKVSDFGLARAWQESSLSGLTITGEQAGTPAFMPPEQILDFHTVRPAGDQYAAAATLYSLLTGGLLYPKATSAADMFKMILQQDPKPIRELRADIPTPLAVAIHRALDRKPDKRFGDVSRFREALLPFAEE